MNELFRKPTGLPHLYIVALLAKCNCGCKTTDAGTDYNNVQRTGSL